MIPKLPLGIQSIFKRRFRKTRLTKRHMAEKGKRMGMPNSSINKPATVGAREVTRPSVKK